MGIRPARVPRHEPRIGAERVATPGALLLVGQDLLATCRFTYDGNNRRLMMSY
jgi:hypothetical protein